MSVRSSSRVGLWSGLGLLVVLALPLGGCKKAGSDSPSAYAGTESQADDPLVELEHLEQRMRQLGLAVAPPAPAPGKGDGSTRATSGAARDTNGGGEGEADGLAADELEAPAGEDGEAGVGRGGEPSRDPSPVSPSAAEASAMDDQPADASLSEQPSRAEQCGNVCDLSEAICDLEVRICSLSDAHRGDPTFADACRRASDDCEVAGFECDRCG